MKTAVYRWLYCSLTVFVLFLTGVAVAQQAKDSADKDKDKKEVPSAGTPAKSDPIAMAPDYVIGPEDVLSINVWKEAEVSAGTVPVRPDGKISLPLINDIQAAGLTPMQLASEVGARLGKFIEQPQVTVVVTAVNSRRVYIVGQVPRAGAFPLLPQMTVLQALSSAGGVSEFADTKKMYVLRNDNGKPVRFPFNYKDVLRGVNASQNIVLKPGDTVVVP
ncbi:MAG TPA: polysaccharide biosynthesis/export family protein [Terriglobales bacterium]|jgi:polysaccharide export outer membrane protein|nr:polysaccharide biosynthesis/export family protein [Terriglobales bacterium]